jgi:hypothetical protein
MSQPEDSGGARDVSYGKISLDLSNIENQANGAVQLSQDPSVGSPSRSVVSSVQSGHSSSKAHAKCTYRDAYGGCDKYAHSPYPNQMRFCARHGGGHRCSAIGCQNHGIDSRRRCRAHGGGRRCEASGCHKSAQSGMGSGSFCRVHYLRGRGDVAAIPDGSFLA